MRTGGSRVVVVGSFNVDHVWQCDALPQAGETLSGTYRSGPGGKGFNQAIAARRAGADTVFVCALGDDAGAQLARALAEAEGVDLRDARSDAPTGTAGIYVDAGGRNSILLGPGANATLSADFVSSHADVLRGAGVLLTQLETATPSILAALQVARDAGVATILNAAPANAPTDDAMLALADVVTPNETEFAALCARHLRETIDADAIAAMADDRLHALCRAVAPSASFVVTLGAAGCFVSHPANRLRGDDAACWRAPAERVHPVDTTGAGDAFNGALAASIAARPAQAFTAHVRFASRYAGLSTERAGAASAMPRLRELEARFGDA